jgi:hypothetical protein
VLVRDLWSPAANNGHPTDHSAASDHGIATANDSSSTPDDRRASDNRSHSAHAAGDRSARNDSTKDGFDAMTLERWAYIKYIYANDLKEGQCPH